MGEQMRFWALLLSVSACAYGATLPEDLAGRRAIRGIAVEPVHESDELKTLRALEEASFSPADSSSATDGEVPSWLAQLKPPDLPVRFTSRVVRYLELYRNDRRGRAIMASWLRKEGRWRALFSDALKRAQLPQSLMYLVMIESGYDPLDRSAAGAVGLWQLMPAGARIYGLRVDFWVDERRSPERATQAAVRYLGDLKERFGAWPLALAAFNAGYGTVLHAMQKYNTNDYWELCRHEDGLPWDTVLYVPKAMAAALVAENRALFGFDERGTETPYAFDAVTVPSSTSLAAVAAAAAVRLDDVTALNPELRRRRTPPEPWSLRLPRGAKERFLAAYPQHQERLATVTVRVGERLDELARDHGTTTRALRALNGIEDSAEVTPGLTLLLPSHRTPAVATTLTAAQELVPVPDKELAVAGRKRLFYRTLATDTVQTVSAAFHVTTTELERWNHLDPEAKLAADLVLQVWVAPDFDASNVVLVDPDHVHLVNVGSDEFFNLVEARRGRERLVYTVQAGDDLAAIGKRFGLSVADLERINRFGADHHALVAGERLIVYRSLTTDESPLRSAAERSGLPRPPPPDGLP